MFNVFVLLIIYQLKHYISDYPLQGPYMLKKFLGGWDWVKPLAAHAGVHAAFTLLISSIYMWSVKGLTYTSLFITLGVTVFDFVVHFCMDRFKASPNMLGRYKALSAGEFMALFKQKKNAEDAVIEATKNDPTGGYAVMAAMQNAILVNEDVMKKMKNNTYFWWSLGLDQMVHHLTHYCIIAALLLS